MLVLGTSQMNAYVNSILKCLSKKYSFFMPSSFFAWIFSYENRGMQRLDFNLIHLALQAL